jgi:serine/threonine-protein kinase
MATVHLARMDGPGGFRKWVAIKRIHQHLAANQAFVRMFLDEARVAAGISHPNVAQVFELGRQGHSYWIAMEYLHGDPLRDVMPSHTTLATVRMDVHLAAKVIADAADGLHAAHELRSSQGEPLNLVHRDVSPQNIFVTYDGAVKVVDFGIAKAAGRLASTRAGTLKGKLSYMSPEQVRGQPVDRRTDVFALGVVLWELATGRRLFLGAGELETLNLVQCCRVPRPSRVAQGVPAGLESIVMKALAKDPRRRFQSGRELSRALQRFVMQSGACVGYEELGAHIRRVLSHRVRARKALLRWASEVISAGTAARMADPAPARVPRPRQRYSSHHQLARCWQPALTADELAPTVVLARPPTVVADCDEEAVTQIMKRPASRMGHCCSVDAASRPRPRSKPERELANDPRASAPRAMPGRHSPRWRRGSIFRVAGAAITVLALAVVTLVSV